MGFGSTLPKIQYIAMIAVWKRCTETCSRGFGSSWQSLRHVSSSRLTWMKWRRHLDIIPTNTLLFCTIRLRRPALQQQQKVNDSNLLICPARKISCNRTGSRTSKLRLEWYPCYATHLHKWSSASSQKAPLIVVNLSCIASSHIPKSMFAASILLKVADARRQPAYLQPI
jgi:hypothetical protein